MKQKTISTHLLLLCMLLVFVLVTKAQNTPWLTTAGSNIGIGTTSPGGMTIPWETHTYTTSFKLDVQNGIVNVGSGAGAFYKAGDYVAIGNMAYGNAPYIAFNANLTKSDITTTINEFTPTYNTGGGIIIEGDAGGSSLHFLQKNYNSGTAPYNLTSFTESMTLTNTGNLGIGTSAPSAKFQVNGNAIIGTGITSLPTGYNLYVSGGILTEHLKVAVKNSTNWADYVFAKDYKLKPLDEVEAFVEKNQHLPEMPSSDELVKDGGIDVNQMFAKQMEKIEELTLYLIEMKKEIKTLKEQNAEMKLLLNNK